MIRKVAAVAAVVGIALIASACGDSPADKARDAGMTNEQVFACEDFVDGVKDVSAEDVGGKLAFARKVNEWAQKAGPELKDAGDILARSANGPAQSWTIATDTFAGKCMQLGWPGDSTE